MTSQCRHHVKFWNFEVLRETCIPQELIHSLQELSKNTIFIDFGQYE